MFYMVTVTTVKPAIDGTPWRARATAMDPDHGIDGESCDGFGPTEVQAVTEAVRIAVTRLGAKSIPSMIDRVFGLSDAEIALGVAEVLGRD